MAITKQEHDDTLSALISIAHVLLRNADKNSGRDKPGLGEIAGAVGKVSDLLNTERYIADTKMQDAAIIEIARRYEIRIPQ